jgi:hypothetical protein
MLSAGCIHFNSMKTRNRPCHAYRRIALLLPLAAVTTEAQLINRSFGSGANAFTMDFVTIGNANNPADTTGAPNPAGSIPYVYLIGKHEVSRDMIEKAIAAAGLGITLADMTSYGGNGLNRPATGVSWYEAATFVNWLNPHFSPLELIDARDVSRKPI